MKDEQVPVPVVVYPKWWLTSRTVLTNLVVMGFAIIGYILDANAVVDLGLGDNAIRYITIASVILGAINVGLRSVTEAPVTLHKPREFKVGE